MKKLICLIMAFCMIFIISGCSNNQTQEKDKLSIVAVSFPEYDFARAVAGDLADIKMLIPPAGEAHGAWRRMAQAHPRRAADARRLGGDGAGLRRHPAHHRGRRGDREHPPDRGRQTAGQALLRALARERALPLPDDHGPSGRDARGCAHP